MDDALPFCLLASMLRRRANKRPCPCGSGRRLGRLAPTLTPLHVRSGSSRSTAWSCTARLAISGAATCNVLETDTDYAERRADAGLDGPMQAFLLVQGRQGVGQPGHDRHRLRGGERPVRQTILQRAAGRRSHV